MAAYFFPGDAVLALRLTATGFAAEGTGEMRLAEGLLSYRNLPKEEKCPERAGL